MKSKGSQQSLNRRTNLLSSRQEAEIQLQSETNRGKHQEQAEGEAGSLDERQAVSPGHMSISLTGFLSS